MKNSAESLPKSDCTLLGQSWVSNGRDLRFVVGLPDGRKVAILFTWVAGLVCDLSYPDDAGGPPLTWDITYTVEEDRWVTMWDFGSRGSIRFSFEDAAYTEVPEELSSAGGDPPHGH